MNKISIAINGAEQAQAELKAAIHAGAVLGIERAGERGVELVVEHTPVGATGLLAQGVFPSLHQNGPVLHMEIADSPPADIYAAPVNYGTRPHMPPVAALLLWVKQKLHVSNEKQATSIAFAIAKTIARRGTKGAHQFDLAYQQLQQEATGIVSQQIAAALKAAGFGAKKQ